MKTNHQQFNMAFLAVITLVLLATARLGLTDVININTSVYGQVYARYDTVNVLPGGSVTGSAAGAGDPWGSNAIDAADSIVNVYSGNITGGAGGDWGGDGIWALRCTVNIYDGSITAGDGDTWGGDGISALGSTVNIHGGSITGGDGGSWRGDGIEIESASTVNIYGTGFNYDFGPISDSVGTITGMLENGSWLNLKFNRDSSSQIILIPEPATVLFLGLGGLLLRRRRR